MKVDKSEEEMKVNKKEEENKESKIKILIPIIILIGLIFLGVYLDSVDYFSNKHLLKGIHVDNWVTFMSSIIAVLGTYIFTRMENKKSLKQQQEQFDEEKRRFDKEKKELEQQFQEEKEIQKENSDKEVIMSLFGSGIIREETLWIFNRKQYKARINYMKNKSISKPVNEKEVRNFGLKDIREFYDLYADIEIINEYVESEKYKKIFNEMIERREGKNTNVKIVLDPEKVIKAVTLTNYKNDIVKIRKEYIEKLLKIIK